MQCSADFYVRLGLTLIVADYPHYAPLRAPDGKDTVSGVTAAVAPGLAVMRYPHSPSGRGCPDLYISQDDP